MSEESTVYTIPLHLFCSKEENRFELSRPFNFGRYTYATDGRIIVRVPIVRVDNYTLVPSRTGLSVARGARSLFQKFPERGFIAITIPKKKDVHRNSNKQHIVQIGASNFNLLFLLKMKRLPNLQVKPPTKPMDFMYFTFDGGIGKLMPTFAQARYTIISPPHRKETHHASPEEKTGSGSGKQSRPAVHSRRKRRPSNIKHQTSNIRRPKLRRTGDAGN